jgi:hypothetical protein
MRSVPYRRWLAGLLISFLAGASPALAQPQAAAPAPDALASAQRFTELCTAKLQLAPAQATALHTYLDQEVDYLGGLALNGLTPATPALVPSEAEQLGQVMARLLSVTQLQQFQKLVQTAPAQACLRSMALLPETPTHLAHNQPRPRHNAPLVAQHLGTLD